MVTFTEEILNEKLHFLCSVIDDWKTPKYASNYLLTEVLIKTSVSIFLVLTRNGRARMNSYFFAVSLFAFIQECSHVPKKLFSSKI